MKAVPGEVHRLGKAVQVVDRQHLNVQLVWNGSEWILVDLDDGDDSMTELAYLEQVSF